MRVNPQQVYIPGIALVRLPFDIAAQAAATAYVLTVIALDDVGIINVSGDDNDGDKSLPAGFGANAGGEGAAAPAESAAPGFGFLG